MKLIDTCDSATISDGNYNHRGPIECEYEPWQKAVKNPGTPVNVKLIVRRLHDGKLLK